MTSVLLTHLNTVPTLPRECNMAVNNNEFIHHASAQKILRPLNH